MRFRDRIHAGRRLVRALTHYANHPDVIVLALARGGVPVGYEVATALNVHLDVLNVRKLGVPGHEEMAMGAMATGDVRVMNERLVREIGISEQAMAQTIDRASRELAHREQLYRENRPAPCINGRIVLLVDDGLATGATMMAAVHAVKKQQAARIVVAVPTAATSTCAEFKEMVDEVVCLHTTEDFGAVGLWYTSFPQTSHDQVRELLRAAKERIQPEMWQVR